MRATRVKELLDECTLEFAWTTKQILGCVIPEDKHIVLNIALQVVVVFIHEIVHIDYPKATEREVDYITAQTVRGMTLDEIREVFNGILVKAQGDLPQMRG